MRHVSCDSCSKDLSEGGEHYTVKMESNKVPASTELTDDDFEDDSVHEMQLMMQGAFEDAEALESQPVRLLRREFDFCEECYTKFSTDPLGLDRMTRRRFSTN